MVVPSDLNMATSCGLVTELPFMVPTCTCKSTFKAVSCLVEGSTLKTIGSLPWDWSFAGFFELKATASVAEIPTHPPSMFPEVSSPFQIPLSVKVEAVESYAAYQDIPPIFIPKFETKKSVSFPASLGTTVNTFLTVVFPLSPVTSYCIR